MAGIPYVLAILKEIKSMNFNPYPKDVSPERKEVLEKTNARYKKDIDELTGSYNDSLKARGLAPLDPKENEKYSEAFWKSVEQIELNYLKK